MDEKLTEVAGLIEKVTKTKSPLAMEESKLAPWVAVEASQPLAPQAFPAGVPDVVWPLKVRSKPLPLVQPLVVTAADTA